jgi:hypothetical protein
MNFANENLFYPTLDINQQTTYDVFAGLKGK